MSKGNEVIKGEAGFANVNGTKLYYETQGEGFPLVMIHGAPLDSRMWNAQMEDLSQHFKVVRFDLANNGQSAVHDEPFDILDDIAQLLDFLGLGEVYLLGLSVGGAIAIDFAIRHSTRVKKLILASSGCLGYQGASEEKKKHQAAIQEQFSQGNMDEGIQLLSKAWVVGPFRQRSDIGESVLQHFEEMAQSSLSRKPGKGKPQFPKTPSIDTLSEIKASTLVLVGNKDFPDYMDIADLLKKDIPNCHKKIIDNAGHMINMEMPDQFNSLVIDFLQENLAK